MAWFSRSLYVSVCVCVQVIYIHTHTQTHTNRHTHLAYSQSQLNSLVDFLESVRLLKSTRNGAAQRRKRNVAHWCEAVFLYFSPSFFTYLQPPSLAAPQVVLHLFSLNLSARLLACLTRSTGFCTQPLVASCQLLLLHRSSRVKDRVGDRYL